MANGAVKQVESLAMQGDPYPYHQPNQLFRNLGGTQFQETTRGDAFTVSEVSRGAAFGDLDNDGDTDVLLLNNHGRARLSLNEIGNRQSWLGLRIVDEHGTRDMLGARVAVHRPGQPPIWRRVHTDASYCSANDPRVLVGLGDRTEITAVEVLLARRQQRAVDRSARQSILDHPPGDRHARSGGSDRRRVTSAL